MPASFFTAISWFRSSASYFCGCNTARPDRSGEGQRDGKNARRSGCIGWAVMLEQTENTAPEPFSAPPAVEKHDGAGEGGGLARGLGLGCLGQCRQPAGERHGR